MNPMEAVPEEPKEVYHYTVGKHFYSIVADGVINPATAFVPKGQRPAVWFTINREWDETANKSRLNPDGSITHLNREETGNLGGGLVRFVVDAKYVPHSWQDFIRLSGIKKSDAKGLAKVARKRGVMPEDWRVIFGPVPRSYWPRVDIWQDGEWCPVEVSKEAEKPEISKPRKKRTSKKVSNSGKK